MAFSLRMPPGLDSRARLKSNDLGITLNALICVALDQYLNTVQDPHVVAVSPPSSPVVVPVLKPDMVKMTRQQIRAAARRAK